MKRISIVAAVLVLGSMTVLTACGRGSDRPAETSTRSANVAAKEAAKDGGGTPMVPDDVLTSSEEREAGVTGARDGGVFLSTRAAN